ncbi:hypothetical protein AMECASPLE_016936 [Ameca splendens]|uniref:Uncharacterized protein n=1 Tax=Ameca splendens TaxID=208324 RepID=A0ABV0ZC33_9TELE
MRQRSTLPYISLAKTPCGLAPRLGKTEGRINLTFTQTSRLLCDKHSPLACKCSGADQLEGAGRKVEAIARSDGLSPQKDKSILNFAIIPFSYLHTLLSFVTRVKT